MGKATHVDCLMCEEIREEARGKLALLGVYLDSIKFDHTTWDENKKLRLRQLFFCCLVRGITGSRDVEWKLVTPSGDLVGGKTSQQKMEFAEQTGLLLGFQSVVFQELGEHTFYLLLDGDLEYEKAFEVSVGEIT